MITTVALTLAATFGGALPSSMATAAPRQATGACKGNEGVTIVVDFQELGGGVNVVCALGTPSTGLDALSTARVAFQTTQRFPGFVCRIAGQPESDPCVNASPASAMWGYWLAAPGGEWCYSPLGAGSRTPVPGTFEGWSFSLAKRSGETPPPRFDPPPAPVAPPASLATRDCDSTPASAAPTTVTPATVTPATVTPTATAATTTATTTATSTTSTTVPSVVTTGTSTVTSTPGTSAASTVAVTNPVDLSEDGADGGSPLGFVVSAAVVAALAAGGAMVIRSRRRA